MTVDEKRKALDEYCDHHGCDEYCPLTGFKTCTCGCGGYFTREPDNKAYMSDAEIIGAYEIVFGHSETIVSESTEQTIALDTLVDTNSITISGVDKISNISIYFKEEN